MFTATVLRLCVQTNVSDETLLKLKVKRTAQEEKIMNTNTTELNFNEMEQVNGGGFWSTISMSVQAEIELLKNRPGNIGYEPYLFGYGNGIIKGIVNAIRD